MDNSKAHRDMSRTSFVSVFYFPQVVNDWIARVVALQVVVWSGVVLILDIWWLVPPLALGFWLRVGFGPRYSPAVKIASKFLVPLIRDNQKPIPGTPKRFAQLLGALLTTTASVLFLTGSIPTARLLMSILLLFAFLEAGFRFCAGCTLYRFLAKIGLFRPEICVDCVLGKDHVHVTAN